ncbi:hypothetical protein [uncultured Clostridium sp.]|uniref:hypothetical protein n=1 Tax=uncultured Clostridium sp. TaxID=59620 RepID=UPI0025E47F3A|nr:hypothetical protein [uncultured Clostridium sp.]
MNKVIKFIIAACILSAVSITPVFAYDYNRGSSPLSSYTFPTAPSMTYQDVISSSAANSSAPAGAPNITGLPEPFSSMCYSPITTNYQQVSYDAFLGTINRTSSQREDIMECVKNFNLSNIGINRTVSEVLGALTPNYDGENSACGWYKDPNNENAVICTCGNYKIYFDCYASASGMDIYATISTANQGIITLSESEIINFFKNLDVKLTKIENAKKEQESSNGDNSANGQYYNNSFVINGNNSGTIIINNK